MKRSRITIGTVALLLLVVADRQVVVGACNLIPSAQTNFRAALGSTDRPFAGPGDLVEIKMRPDVCDSESAGLPASPNVGRKRRAPTRS